MPPGDQSRLGLQRIDGINQSVCGSKLRIHGFRLKHLGDDLHLTVWVDQLDALPHQLSFPAAVVPLNGVTLAVRIALFTHVSVHKREFPDAGTGKRFHSP